MNGTRGLVIAVAAAFIVGCSVGLMGGILFMRLAGPGSHSGLLASRMGREHARAPYFGPEGPGMRGGPDRMLPALERMLDLSPEQRERIITQLDRARREHAAVRESMHVWLQRELTPAQRERWKQMEERFERSGRGRNARGPLPLDRP